MQSLCYSLGYLSHPIWSTFWIFFFKLRFYIVDIATCSWDVNIYTLNVLSYYSSITTEWLMTLSHVSVISTFPIYPSINPFLATGKFISKSLWVLVIQNNLDWNIFRNMWGKKEGEAGIQEKAGTLWSGNRQAKKHQTNKWGKCSSGLKSKPLGVLFFFFLLIYPLYFFAVSL